MTDPNLWLEDITGDDALTWVRERNGRTVERFTAGEDFETLRKQVLDVLDSDERIPYVRRRADHLYNYWRDAEHPRGLWRRTTLAGYQAAQTEWEVVIDLDAIAAEEDRNWVWQGAQLLRPDLERALVSLSVGGADAVVVREFDMVAGRFIDESEGGFVVPEAKTRIGWIDRDTVYIGSDFGQGSMTDSGYPRTSRRWTRGTTLADAPTVYEGSPSDVSVGVSYDSTPGFERTFVSRAIDFYNSEIGLLGSDDSIEILDVPSDASVDVHHRWMTIRPMTDWTVTTAAGPVTHPAGALLTIDFDAYRSGSRDLTTLFTPDEHRSLHQYAWTKTQLLLGGLTDVKTDLSVATPPDDPTGPWSIVPLDLGDEPVTTDVIATASREGDEFWLSSSGFLTPPTLLRGEARPEGATEVAVIRSTPTFFDADGMTVQQFFATSADGTRVPYFVVGTPGNGPKPTLLYGYGGFEVSLTPSYSGVIGRTWLESGYTYVLANIRGGGEYGPAWHTDVLGPNRYKVGEDFAAVAKDLIERGITTTEQLGARGGSNGGLLMGIMLTGYPELFGAIVCEVPLLDMRRYHLLLAGASWVAEYGDPDDPKQWEFISEYSPYQNISTDRRYPPVLITTSTRDDRVHPGHARKMTAALEAAEQPVFYYENIEGGHGGAADNSQAAFKSALAATFLRETIADMASGPNTSPESGPKVG